MEEFVQDILGQIDYFGLGLKNPGQLGVHVARSQQPERIYIFKYTYILVIIQDRKVLAA